MLRRTPCVDMYHLQARGGLSLGADEARRRRPQPTHLRPEGRQQAGRHGERNDVDRNDVDRDEPRPH